VLQSAFHTHFGSSWCRWPWQSEWSTAMGAGVSSVTGPVSSCTSSCSSNSIRLTSSSGNALPPGVCLEDNEIAGVEFTEKAIFASPLPAKMWIEIGRWNPVSLLLLAPAWSYTVSGTADHWWFVARSANHMYYYVAQFCADCSYDEDDDEDDDPASTKHNHVSGLAFLGMWAAVATGLQYPEAQWWHARTWKQCNKPRQKVDLDRLIRLNPAVKLPYSWVDNNCQHFCVYLYEGLEEHSA